jgi:mannosyl-oligosaccharide alpha-1,2-mannosidase
MLGATRTGALVHPVSVPPKPEELSEKGKRDWKTGVELIQTCMHTHDTATYVPGEFAVDLEGYLLETCWFYSGLSPEIVYFRVPSDGMDVLPSAPADWYIKGAA